MIKTSSRKSRCCIHMNAAYIEKAAAAVQIAAVSHSTHDMICIDCGLSGMTTDINFRQHFLIDQHYIHARIKQPAELYCCHCGDYQYSDYFDLLVGRKRAQSNTSTAASQRLKKMLLDRPQPRAIVNMGATCFMGSVLQVMLNNSVVLFSKQMQLNKSGLEPCSKERQDRKRNNNSNGSHSDGEKTVGEGADIAASATDSSSSSSSSCITSGCIACEFRSLFWDSMDDTVNSSAADSKNKGPSAIIPSNLLYSVWSHADYMAGYDQQDAHEFLIALLDGLGSHLEKYHGEVNNSFPRYPSPYGEGSSSNNSNSNSRSNSISIYSNNSNGKHALSRSNSISLDLPHVGAPSSSSSLARSEFIPNINGDGCSPRYCMESPRFPIKSQWSPRGSSPRGGSASKNNCFRGFVNEVFAGWMQSELQCMHCNHCSYKLEPFLDISLSLDISSTPSSDYNDKHSNGFSGLGELDKDQPEAVDAIDLSQDSEVPSSQSSSTNWSRTNLKDDSISLSKCLQHFTSLETLSEQVHCDVCQQHRPSKKRLSISAAPKVLILHFKRFDSLRQLKICSKVQFPLRGLDLAPFVRQQHKNGIPSTLSAGNDLPDSGSVSRSNSTSDLDGQDNHLLYDLQGIVNHKGSLTQGHYVAYVAAMNGTTTDEAAASTSWLRCDDDTVTPISEEDVQNVEGYILFYICRKNSLE